MAVSADKLLALLALGLLATCLPRPVRLILGVSLALAALVLHFGYRAETSWPAQKAVDMVKVLL